MHFATTRMLKLALAPLGSAWLAREAASWRQARNAFIDPRYHYWRSFWFTPGIVLVRFAYASR